MDFETDPTQVAWAREIIKQSWDHRASRVVQVASLVGLFAALADGSADSAAMARRLGLDADMTDKVLIACAAMDLVRRDGGGWALMPKAEATLVPGGPLYQGHTLAHNAGVWAFWNDLEPALRGQGERSVRSGQAAEGITRSHRDFIMAMHNMTMAGRGLELAERVDLAGRRKLVDVGGGPGTYSIALCRRYGDLEATILDLPETIEIAREVVSEFAVADRVHLRAGSWDEDDFGRANDAVLMSNILHGPTSAAEMKLEKAYRSLKPGGLLIVQDFLLNDEKTGPLTPALFNIMVGAFSEKELRERIVAAGFIQLESQPMPQDLGTTLITAKK